MRLGDVKYGILKKYLYNQQQVCLMKVIHANLKPSLQLKLFESPKSKHWWESKFITFQQLTPTQNGPKRD